MNKEWISKKDKIMRDHIDNMMWLLALGTAKSAASVLTRVKDVRDRFGSGWWDASLERIESAARKRLSSLGRAEK